MRIESAKGDPALYDGLCEIARELDAPARVPPAYDHLEERVKMPLAFRALYRECPAVAERVDRLLERTMSGAGLLDAFRALLREAELRAQRAGIFEERARDLTEEATDG